MTLLTAPLPGLYLALLAFLLAQALRRWWDPVPVRVWGGFGVIVVILFGPALFLGKVLLPADILPWVRTPEEMRAPPDGNPLQLDLVTQIVPLQVEVRRALGAGTWPAWNPDVGAGMPLLADPQAQALQPLVLAALPLPLWQAIGVTAGLKVLISLVFFFLLMRRQGLSEGAALFGSLAYSLGGFVMLWLNWPLATPAALLPLVLYALAMTDDRGARRDFGLLVAALFTLLVAGHPETILDVLIVGALFAGSRLFRRQRGERTSLFLRWALAGVISLGLAAPALVSAARYVPQSLRHLQVEKRNDDLRNRGPLAYWRTSDERQHSLPGLRRRFVSVFAPNAFGNDRYGSYWGDGNTNEDAAGFVGGAALLAALLAFVPTARRFPAERLFLGTAVASLAVTVGLPGLLWLLAVLPVLNQSVSGHRRLLMVLAFSLSYLGACTVERWRCREGAPRRWAVAVVAVLLLGLIAWSYRGSPRPAGVEDIESLRAFWFNLQLAAVAVTGIVMMSRVQSWRICALLVLVAAELLMIHGPANPGLPRRDFYPVTPAVAFLQEHADGSRIAGLEEQMLPNTASVYGLADLRASNPLKPQLYVDAVAPVSLSPWTTEHTLAFEEHPIYQLLGVRWIIAPSRYRAIHGLKQVFHDSTARIFERKRALPILFLPESTEVPGAVQWTDWIAKNPHFDVRAMVLPVPGRPAVWSASRPDDSTLEILRQQPARFSVRALLAEDRLLATSLYQDQGWHLLLDGRPHSALVANGPFLAAWLPAGTHRVEAIYRAPGLIPGLMLAALALTGMTAWLLRPRSGCEPGP
jgi:membrane protein YfhO